MVRVLGYGFGVRGRKVKSVSRDCALASDLVRAFSPSENGRRISIYHPSIDEWLCLQQ